MCYSLDAELGACGMLIDNLGHWIDTDRRVNFLTTVVVSLPCNTFLGGMRRTRVWP